MTSLVKTIFLKESEKDIFHALREQGIDTSILEARLEELFKRVYNNEVGYYIFRQDGKIYKLLILPKTINPASKTAEKEFVNYLLHYYRVNNVYQYDETKHISESLLSLAFKTNNSEEPSSHKPIDEFEFYKYMTILEAIERFFKKHKNYKKTTIDYISQSVKHKLNLSKNLKELDKSKIHQTRTIDRMYSEMATIAYHALKLFLSHKIDHLDETNRKKLSIKVRQISTFLAKKYQPDKAYKLTLPKLNGFKVFKVFNANGERKQLLTDIRSLFGFEQMYSDNEMSVENRYDLTTTSFFIDPILFYEWYVYDILKKYAEEQSYQILFDKDKKNKTTIKYDLTSKEHNKDNNRSSNPDYVLIDEEKKVKIVLDAKWKTIDRLEEIKSSDFLKLQHDDNLSKSNGYRTIPYLIYPKYLSRKDKVSIPKDENRMFDFGIFEIDMNFEKDNNHIDFTYDFGKIEEQLETEKEENIVKRISEQYSNDIDSKRSELINKLFNSDDLENKEEVLVELDEKLIEFADEISQNIEENISDEVKSILETYDDVLEEDSKKFLKSSSSIYNYYKDKNMDHFDYSMPGSGLWKLVELELNTSFVWYIRIKNGVCDHNSEWNPLLEQDEVRNIKWVKLNEFERGKIKLRGLMFGEIKFLSGNKTVKRYFDNEFILNELYDFLQKIVDIRNEHAHIKAMSLNIYEELNSILFNKEDDRESLLESLLEMKKIIREHISK